MEAGCRARRAELGRAPARHRPRGGGALALALGWALAGAGAAAALGTENFSAHVTFSTDYVFRGISQTREDPAVQGGINFEHGSGFFAGLWSSNVEFPQDVYEEQPRDLELDLHVGYGRDLAEDWSAYVALVHYEYPGAHLPFDYDYEELHLALQYRELASLAVALSDDALGFGEQAAAYELAGRYPLPARLDLVTGIGHYDLKDVFGARYWYWNLGLSRRLNSFVLDLGYFDTDDGGTELYGRLAGSRWVVSVTAATP